MDKLLDMEVVDKQAKKSVVMGVAIAGDSNIRKKEYKKLEKYQRLKKMWRTKVTVVHVAHSGE